MSNEDELIARVQETSIQLTKLQATMASLQADLHMLKLINKILEEK